jgi:hypothetical protein
VTVGARFGVTIRRVVCGVPTGDGRDSGVLRGFGVGVGGLSNSWGSVGAMRWLTKKTAAIRPPKKTIKKRAVLRFCVPLSLSNPKMADRRPR